MITSKELRDKRRYLHEQNKRFQPGVFIEIPREQWPRTEQAMITRVLRSRDFLVQVFAGDFTRLTISRTELNNAGQWKDGISWDELQGIKNACGFGARDAVEAYPKAGDEVTGANMRHLWIVPESYTRFFWRGGKGSGLRLGNVAENLLTHENNA